MATTELRTARLRLRPLRLGDAPALFAWRGDAETMRWWDWPAPENVGEVEDVIVGHAGEREAGATLWWAMARRSDKRLIGECDLSEIDHHHRRAELGFIVARDVWRQGYGLEAMSAVVDHAFGTLGLERLAARVHDGNIASQKLLERLGFAYEGRMVGAVLRDGARRDCLIFGLLKFPSAPSSPRK